MNDIVQHVFDTVERRFSEAGQSVQGWSSRPSWASMADATTWTYKRETVPGVGLVSTVWSPIRFAPAYGLPGTAKHYETLAWDGDDNELAHAVYATEQEAKDGHARIVAGLQTTAGAA
jgi:hypothetical protein